MTDKLEANIKLALLVGSFILPILLHLIHRIRKRIYEEGYTNGMYNGARDYDEPGQSRWDKKMGVKE